MESWRKQLSDELQEIGGVGGEKGELGGWRGGVVLEKRGKTAARTISRRNLVMGGGESTVTLST